MAPVKGRFLGGLLCFALSPPKLEDSQAGREETMNGNWNCSSSCLLSTVLTSFTKKNGQVLCQSGGVGTNRCLLFWIFKVFVSFPRLSFLSHLLCWSERKRERPWGRPLYVKLAGDGPSIHFRKTISHLNGTVSSLQIPFLSRAL